MNADQLNAHLASGKYVQVTTYTKSIIYGPKHAGWFTQGKDGCVYVNHNKGKVCLSMSNGAFLVGVRLSK